MILDNFGDQVAWQLPIDTKANPPSPMMGNPGGRVNIMQWQLAGKGALLADIGGFYTAFGLTPSTGEPEVEDHIAAELEFMSALYVKEAWALAEDATEGLAVTRAAQAAFLADHLGRWAAVFAAEIVAATPLAYYTAAAALLSLWVDAECDRLGVAPSRVAGRLGHDPIQNDTFTCPMAAAEDTDAIATHAGE